ncbi:MAG: hypothetical protein ACNI3C_00245 [Candidatus Marinarcus sp.]|uniref:hypothetical protein n=1 Tax=Candidatus Marinarcus sp. TaxID=3100987 RepID=UPI003B008632
MREDWVAYVVVLTVVAFMLLGKKMIFFGDSVIVENEPEEEILEENIIPEVIPVNESEIPENTKC